MLTSILQQYGFTTDACAVTAFGTGLINNTWLVEEDGKRFILQRINQNIFKFPQAIDDNIHQLATYLQQHHKGYTFTTAVKNVYGKTLVVNNDGAFRLFAFIEGSHTYDVLQKPQQAYEAAQQFGRFTKLLCGFNAQQLAITLPNFHNLTLRYNQFILAEQDGNKERIAHAAKLIQTLKRYEVLVKIFEEIQTNPAFKQRVTHHDTKISNVLFDGQDKGICVIDLDTVMPGYFISDVGDMLRTYLPGVDENEANISKVTARDEYFDAVMQGYLGEMKDELGDVEKSAFVYAGQFMIYMQALRFLTDYLQDDVYYGAKYPMHNYDRAANQTKLLEELVSKEAIYKEKVRNFIGV